MKTETNTTRSTYEKKKIHIKLKVHEQLVVLSLNNSRDLVTISVASIPKELELKDTTDPVRSTSYLDLLFEITYY
jgi:hypothetical protein